MRLVSDQTICRGGVSFGMGRMYQFVLRLTIRRREARRASILTNGAPTHRAPSHADQPRTRLQYNGAARFTSHVSICSHIKGVTAPKSRGHPRQS